MGKTELDETNGESLFHSLVIPYVDMHFVALSEIGCSENSDADKCDDGDVEDDNDINNENYVFLRSQSISFLLFSSRLVSEQMIVHVFFSGSRTRSFLYFMRAWVWACV